MQTGTEMESWTYQRDQTQTYTCGENEWWWWSCRQTQTQSQPHRWSTETAEHVERRQGSHKPQQHLTDMRVVQSIKTKHKPAGIKQTHRKHEDDDGGETDDTKTNSRDRKSTDPTKTQITTHKSMHRKARGDPWVGLNWTLCMMLMRIKEKHKQTETHHLQHRNNDRNQIVDTKIGKYITVMR